MVSFKLRVDPRDRTPGSRQFLACGLQSKQFGRNLSHCNEFSNSLQNEMAKGHKVPPVKSRKLERKDLDTKTLASLHAESAAGNPTAEAVVSSVGHEHPGPAHKG